MRRRLELRQSAANGAGNHLEDDLPQQKANNAFDALADRIAHCGLMPRTVTTNHTNNTNKKSDETKRGGIREQAGFWWFCQSAVYEIEMVFLYSCYSCYSWWLLYFPPSAFQRNAARAGGILHRRPEGHDCAWHFRPTTTPSARGQRRKDALSFPA